ncbi:MAG: hypothetical protein ACJ8BW_13615, partial [Ktedonobacteraceae bacterium]
MERGKGCKALPIVTPDRIVQALFAASASLHSCEHHERTSTPLLERGGQKSGGQFSYVPLELGRHVFVCSPVLCYNTCTKRYLSRHCGCREAWSANGILFVVGNVACFSGRTFLGTPQRLLEEVSAPSFCVEHAGEETCSYGRAMSISSTAPGAPVAQRKNSLSHHQPRGPGTAMSQAILVGV